jgi:hypothetical protein
LGLFFTSTKRTPVNDLLDQFEALQPAPMLLGFQTKFEDHGLGCVTVEEAVLLR